MAGQPSPYRTNGRTELDGAAVSLLRPQPHIADARWRELVEAAVDSRSARIVDESVAHTSRSTALTKRNVAPYINRNDDPFSALPEAGRS